MVGFGEEDWRGKIDECLGDGVCTSVSILYYNRIGSCVGLLAKVDGFIIGWWNINWCGVVKGDRGVGFGHGVAVCCVTIADIISLFWRLFR